MIRKSTILIALAAFALLMGFAGMAGAQGTDSFDEAIPANLVPPDGSVLLFDLHAKGVQIYTCDVDPKDASAYTWNFTAPDAELLNRRGEVVAEHYAGPTWEGLDGSEVVGATVERADSPDAGSIPWLLLKAKEHAGNGAFSTITYVQRLDTAGGAAPADGCDADHAGDEARQPYEATYAFYYAAAPATPEASTPGY